MKRLIIGAVVGALGIAACGGGSDSPRAASTTTPAVLVTTTVAATAAPPTTTTTTVPPTTATVAPTTTTSPLEADKALVRTLYYDYSQSWSTGFDAGYQYRVEHLYPGIVYTAEECYEGEDWRDANGNPFKPTEYSESIVPDVDTMAPDPDWVIPSGRYAALHPDGRTYILPVTMHSRVERQAEETTTRQVHVSIKDGAAFFFFDCG